jgi:hypothetical protein
MENLHVSPSSHRSFTSKFPSFCWRYTSSCFFHLSFQQTTLLWKNSLWCNRNMSSETKPCLCHKCINISFQLPHQHTRHSSWHKPVSTDWTREEASSSAHSCVWHWFGEHIVFIIFLLCQMEMYHRIALHTWTSCSQCTTGSQCQPSCPSSDFMYPFSSGVSILASVCMLRCNNTQTLFYFKQPSHPGCTVKVCTKERCQDVQFSPFLFLRMYEIHFTHPLQGFMHSTHSHFKYADLATIRL